MPTSLHDLLDALNIELDATGPSSERRADAAQALGPLGRTLHRLADDGISDEVGGYRERFVRELAAACPAETTRTHLADQRLSMLNGAIADTVQILRPEFRIASRWAAALELAATARRLADTAADRRADPLAPYARLRRACVLVERTGAIEPPTAEHARLLDRAIPTPLSQPPGTPAARITEANAGLIHHTRPGTNLSIAEVLAVCIAAETLCATAAILHQHNQLESQSLKSAAHAWRHVGIELQPFNDGSRHRHEDRPTLIAWATRLHDTLRQTTPTNLATAPGDRATQDARDVGDAVAACIPQLPTLGQHLCELIQQWPATGQVLAYAHQLPPRQERLDQQLAGHRAAGLVRADATDLTPVLQAVRNAAQTRRTPHTSSPTRADEFPTTPVPAHRQEPSRVRLSDWGSLQHKEPQGPSPAGHGLAAAARTAQHRHPR